MTQAASKAAASPIVATRRALVVGATGNVGAPLIPLLQAHGILVRAGVSNPDNAHPALTPLVERTRLNLYDASTFETALRDCDALYLMRPPAISNVETTLFRLIDVAAQRGISRVVFLSVAGNPRHTFIPHYRVEAYLHKMIPEATLLRPGFFAQNVQSAYRFDIQRDHRIYVPAGDGRVAFVDARDIAEVAAMALANPELHAGHAYTLTGSEAITFGRVAELLSQALNRTIRYERASATGYLWHNTRALKLPLAQAVVQLVLHLGLRRGNAAAVDATLGELLQRPPRTMAQYVSDHVSVWTTHR